MATKEKVYQDFGFTSEAAQLLEMELASALLFHRVVEDGIITVTDEGIEIEKDGVHSTKIYESINRQTLGQLIANLKKHVRLSDDDEKLVRAALKERNRLQHHFFPEHNFRLNSADGREIMLADLAKIYGVIFGAYKRMMLLSGMDLDKVDLPGEPTQHVCIIDWTQ